MAAATVSAHGLPTSINYYVHCVGCTSRAGNTSLAIVFFNRGNKNNGSDMINLLMKPIKKFIAFWNLLPERLVLSVDLGVFVELEVTNLVVEITERLEVLLLMA